MPSIPRPRRRSLYWRIAVGFILFLAAILVVQAGLFVWLIARAGTEPGRMLSDYASVVAVEVSDALSRDPALDLRTFLREQYSRAPHHVYIVTRQGLALGAEPGAPPPNIVRRAVMLLRGNSPMRDDVPGGMWGRRLGGFAPVISGERAVAMVVVLPSQPVLTLAREFGPALGIIGILVLTAATLFAALVVFRPVRRRLLSFQQAVGRLGAGDTAARASEEGGDEIAELAIAFNRMASDLEARTRALETADRTRRQLLADVSHELMTPLTAIRGYVETLAMPHLAITPEARARYLDVIDQEAQRLERLIGDLLDLARFEAGGVALASQDVPVVALFDRVTARHERDCRDRKITMTQTIGQGADTVRCDPDRLEQALQNLAANALRHTGAGGRVDLVSTVAAGSIVLSVRDTGAGIPAEHLPHVFDRFYKVDSARGGGSGLGLSIVRAIVERHGGTVTARSEVGAGTVFEIRLPGPASHR